MFGKFLKHELKAVVNGIRGVFGFLLPTYWVCFKWGLVIALILLPLACLIGSLPSWFFGLEVLGIIIFIFYKRYLKFTSENREETDEEADEEADKEA